MIHKFLYDEEFEREEFNLFPSKNIPLDWIIWYDGYNKKFRDPLYSYWYRLHTSRYFHDPKYRFEQGLIKFSRASNKDLVETEPTYLHEVYSKYIIHYHNQGKSVSVPYNNILVYNIFEKDLLYIGLCKKYTYWHVFPDEDKNSQFLYYLSTIEDTSDKFENIYYEPNYEKEHTSIYDSIKFSNQKNAQKNVAPDSEDISEPIFLKNSCTFSRNSPTGHFCNVQGHVREDCSTGALGFDFCMDHPTHSK